MNYLTVNPPPLQGDEDTSTSAAGLNFPFGIPFTNQSAFQSAFTPEGFSFESPFGMPSTSFQNTSSLDGNAHAGPSSAPRAKSFAQNNAAGLPQPNHLNGLAGIIPSGVYDNLSNPTNVSLVTGDRFSQLLEAKLGLDLSAQKNAMSAGLPTQPFPGATPSTLEPFDHLAVEQALKDYSQIQVPPDFVAPALQDSYLQSNMAPRQFPFYPTPNSNGFQKAQSSTTPLLPPSNDFLQPSLYDSSATLHTLSSSSTPSRHSPNHHSNLMTPFDPPLDMSHANSDQSLPPPLRIHLQQTPVPSHRELKPSKGVPDMADGSWAMELLKGYKSAQSRLDFTSWSGIASNSTLPQSPYPAQTRVMTPNPPTAAAIMPAAVSNSTSAHVSTHTESSSAVSEPVAKPRKRSSKTVKGESPESSGSEYEDVTPKRKRSSTSRRISTNEEPKDGSDKKPIIACHICRARKLKCNGAKPKCSNCVRRNEDDCVYDTVLRRRGPGRNNKKDRRSRNGRPKGGGSTNRSKLDPHRSSSSESMDDTPDGHDQRAVSIGKGDESMGMGWDQVLMSSMVR